MPGPMNELISQMFPKNINHAPPKIGSCRLLKGTMLIVLLGQLKVIPEKNTKLR